MPTDWIDVYDWIILKHVQTPKKSIQLPITHLKCRQRKRIVWIVVKFYSPLTTTQRKKNYEEIVCICPFTWFTTKKKKIIYMIFLVVTQMKGQMQSDAQSICIYL